MERLSIRELDARCQKPDHRRLGTWMARRIARPVAVRVTWLVAPWGATANMATLAAWAAAIGGAVLLGWGTPLGWLLAAGLLQVWYLLDHVDGQLARLRGTASLDGVQLDYLMHHTVHLLIPTGAGYGLFAASGQTGWLLAGLVWGLSLLLITLHHDARYKAFTQRLKCVRGRLELIGGGAYRPEPPPPAPRRPLRLTAYVARKGCEMHVVMNILAVVSAGELAMGDAALMAGRVYVAVMAVAASAVAGWTIVRSQRNHLAEKEFAAWFRPAEGHEMVFRDGWFLVQEAESTQTGKTASGDGSVARPS